MNKNISIVRELAKKVKEIASLPVQEEKRKLWYKHNSLKGERPLILIFPEGSWRELLPEDSLECTGEYYRQIEWELRSRIYYHEHLKDDAPIEEEFHVYKKINGEQVSSLPYGEWGLDIKRHYNESGEMFSFEQSLNSMDDIEKLKAPKLIYEEEASIADLGKKQEILGDILTVILKGYTHISFHMMERYSGLRGLNQMYIDFYENPEMVHRVMEIFTNGYLDLMDDAVEQGLFELNNYSSYQSTGGKSYTHELPAKDYKGKVRIKDLWANSESQELSGVSPSMHKEFALDYEKRLLERFGLTGYGCCEPLHDRLDDVLEIPNIRRVSISPFADAGTAAGKLGSKAIYSFKPQPSHLVGHFDEDFVYGYLKNVIDICSGNGCKLEIVLKDTHTCEHRPERFEKWIETARKAVCR